MTDQQTKTHNEAITAVVAELKKGVKITLQETDNQEAIVDLTSRILSAIIKRVEKLYIAPNPTVFMRKD